MADPWGIVVVPAEGGLLANGACGARAPMTLRRVHRGGWVCWDQECLRAHHLREYEYGLPIWWDGKLVPEGWDRLRRVAYTLHPAWMMPTIMEPTVDQLLMVARFLMKVQGARVVLLDLVDGRIVERAP